MSPGAIRGAAGGVTGGRAEEQEGLAGIHTASNPELYALMPSRHKGKSMPASSRSPDFLTFSD